MNRLLHFAPHETTLAALGLMILAYLSWIEVNSFDIFYPFSSGWVIRLVRPFFSFALSGILTTSGAIIAVLIAMSLNVSAYKNNYARSFVRVCLLAMFLMILVDLLLHAAMGEMIRRAYYPG